MPVSTTAPRAVLALLFACICWGLSFPLGRGLVLAQSAAVPEATTWCLSAWDVCIRFIIATAFIAWWCRRELARPTAAEWYQGVGLGVFTSGGIVLQVDALTYAPASTVAFLTQGYAVWIPLLVAIRTRRQPATRTILCIVTVLIGVGLLAGVEPGHLSLGRGEIETLVCSLLFTGQILWAERPGYAANRTGLVTVLAFATACVSMIPVVVMTAPSTAVLFKLIANPLHLALIAVLGVLCTGIGMLVMFRYQQVVGATAAAIIYCSEPVFASLFAFVIPGLLAGWLAIAYANESCTTTLLVGGGLICAANVAMQWRSMSPKACNET